MAHTGRKPLAAGHVDHLQGSDRARLRLRVMLECLTEARTIPDACQELQIGESRFHALRNDWLQESVEFFEPQRSGRPPKQLSGDQLLERLTRLEAENDQLRQQLREAQVRQEVAAINGPLPEASKKTAPGPRRRRARRRPR